MNVGGDSFRFKHLRVTTSGGDRRRPTFDLCEVYDRDTQQNHIKHFALDLTISWIVCWSRV